jgi:hypothetical protein
MVHIYYHIYAIDGVESIIDEQISLIQKHFDFAYKLNIGISIANENIPSKPILDKIYGYNKPNYKIRDIRCRGNEFTTLDLILEDSIKFGDSDYILYIHTKGASKQLTPNYDNIKSWRHLMNYFNIEKVKSVFNIFEKTEFNTYGVLYGDLGRWKLYSGNFWWMKGSYAKTIDSLYTKKQIRFYAETEFVSMGKDWNPYSAYNRTGENHYNIEFKREEYTK